MVVFRLTQEEYRKLQQMCTAQGGRNVSDFTRSELLARIDGDAGDAGLEKRLHAVEQQLLAVQCTVQNLLGSLDERCTERAEPAPLGTGEAPTGRDA
jgi:hypothetical protein